MGPNTSEKLSRHSEPDFLKTNMLFVMDSNHAIRREEAEVMIVIPHYLLRRAYKALMIRRTQKNLYLDSRTQFGQHSCGDTQSRSIYIYTSSCTLILY